MELGLGLGFSSGLGFGLGLGLGLGLGGEQGVQQRGGRRASEHEQAQAEQRALRHGELLAPRVLEGHLRRRNAGWNTGWYTGCSTGHVRHARGWGTVYVYSTAGGSGRAALSLEPRGLGAYASVNRGACPPGDADGRAQAVEQSEEVAVGAHGQRYLGGVRGRGQGQW